MLASLGVAALFFFPVVFTRDSTFFAFPDNSIQSYAWLSKVGTAWRNLDPPLWDFSVQSGTSFVGELQTGAFYPPSVILAWLSRPHSLYAFELFLVIHFALAGYFMLCFLRLGVSLGAALAGAIIFAFAGTVARKAVYQANIFVGLVYLPAIAGLFLRGLGSRGPVLTNPWFYLSGIALGFSMLAGHMQPYIHSAMALGVLVPFVCYGSRVYSWRSALTGLVFVGVVSVALTAIQWVPTVEYLDRSYRWIGLPEPIRGLATPPHAVYAQHEVLQPLELASLFDHVIDARDGGTLFISLTGLALAVIGCFQSSRLSRFGLTLALLSVLVALGDYTMIGRHSWYVPVLSYVREPVRTLFLYHFGMSVLAAIGLQSVIDRMSRRRLWSSLIAVAAAGLILFEASRHRDWIARPIDSGVSPVTSYARDSLLTFLEDRMSESGRLYRIHDPERVLPPNIGDVYAIHSTLGHRATMNANYFDYRSRDGSLESVGLDRLGAKYVVSPTPLEGFPELFRAGGRYVYERPGALPVFQLLSPTGERKPARVSSIRWSQNTVSFTLENPAPGELLFAQPYFPRWRAVVDGRTIEPRKNDIFMSVPLSGSERSIAWVYTPAYLWLAVATALLMLAGLAASLASAWRHRERPGP